jgi:uncharacterized protein (TIGR02266 family)
MTQDTRKDRRVKIVSLNVRYKSATVDEFIENHAHDVSRGGMYIKTGSPFPPGTLLKFEIRLSSDQAVIMGVGRVVWKRDNVQGTGDRPAGMGVKFIKIDDPSKGVIDKLVNSRADAGQAYESESESPQSEVPAPAAAAKPAAQANRNVGKSTMLGVGAVSAAARAPSNRPSSPLTPPRPASTAPPSGGGMFPKTNSEADMPPKQEQTVMKQAAELLEEALREAGGSMEDVGTNPLFAGSPSATKSDRVSPVPADGEPPPVAADEPSASDAEAARARAIIAGMSPASVAPKRSATTDPPRTTRESPVAKAPERESTKPAAARSSGRVSVASAPPKPPKKKGGGGAIVIVGVVAIAAFFGAMYRDTLFGAAAPEPAVAPPIAPLPTPSSSAAMPAPSAVESPSATASSEPAASARASAAPAVTDAAAAPSASASGAPSASAAATPPHPVAVPRPIAPRPVAPAPVAPAITAAPTSETPRAATTATATTATPPPAPKPKPTAKPSDDNPY